MSDSLRGTLRRVELLVKSIVESLIVAGERGSREEGRRRFVRRIHHPSFLSLEFSLRGSKPSGKTKLERHFYVCAGIEFGRAVPGNLRANTMAGQELVLELKRQA